MKYRSADLTPKRQPSLWTTRVAVVMMVLLCASLAAAQQPQNCFDPPGPGVDWTDCVIDNQWLLATFGLTDLAGENLSNATLVGTYFELVDLSGADFSGADLSSSVFDLCNLQGATGSPIVAGAEFYTTTCPDGSDSDAQGFMCSFNYQPPPPPPPEADLSVTIGNGVNALVPGKAVSYSIVAGNIGPDDAPTVTLTAQWPLELQNAQTSCEASGGASCPAAGKTGGGLDDQVNLPASSSLSYTLTGTVDPSAVGYFDVSTTIAISGGFDKVVIVEDPTDPNLTNNNASDSDPLTPEADLSVTVDNGLKDVTPGAEVNYQVVAANSGPSNAPNSAVQVLWPGELEGAGWSCEGAGGAVCSQSKTLGNINETVMLPPGGSLTYSVTGTVADLAFGSLAVSASVAVDQGQSAKLTPISGVTDPDGSNNFATDEDPVIAKADLAISIDDGISKEIPGTEVSYTIVASNSGPNDAPGAMVSVSWPESLQQADWFCVALGDASCQPEKKDFESGLNQTVDLPAGSSVIFNFSATIDPKATGELVVSASVSIGKGDDATVKADGVPVVDPKPENNSASDIDLLTPKADLAITVDNGVKELVPGNEISYAVVASNSGPSDAPGSTVAVTWPEQLTGVDWECVATGTAHCPKYGQPKEKADVPEEWPDFNEWVDLPAGSSIAFTFTGMVDSAATYGLEFSASVKSQAPKGDASTKEEISGIYDPDLKNNSASDFDLLAPEADLAITIDNELDEVTAGTEVTYTIVASNAGPSDAPDAVVSAYVPSNFEEFTWDCEGSGGAKCGEIKRAGFEDWANLPAGSSLTYTLSGVVSSAASGDFTVDASVVPSWDDFRKSDEPEAPKLIDPDLENNTASDSDPVGFEADLLISTDGPEEMVAGTDIEFQITVANDGPSDVAGALVEDAFPVSLTDVSWICDSVEGAQCTASGSGDIKDTIDLAAGSSATYSVTAKVDPATVEPLSNTATVTGPDGVTELDTGNNSSALGFTVTAESDLEADLSDGVDSVLPGEVFEITGYVENVGPSNSSGGHFFIGLPDGLYFVSSEDGCHATVGKKSADFTCDFGALEVDEWANFRVVLEAGAEVQDATHLVVQGSTVGDQTDPNPENDQAELEILVDTDYPTVLSVGTADGVLSECDSVTATTSVMNVAFSERVINEPLKNADSKFTSVQNFLLVAIGDDGFFDTSSCVSGPAGDDISLPTGAVLWNRGGTAADLDFGAPLEDGLYRFLVCASGSFEDAAGKELDGDGNGAPGDDLLIGFRVDQGNAFDNGHLDCGTSGWEISHPERFQWLGAVDRQLMQESGSGLMNSSSSGLSQCVDLVSDTANFEASVFLQSTFGGVNVTLTCVHYASGACEGQQLGTDSGVINLDEADLSEWVDLTKPVVKPEGTQSSYCSMWIGGVSHSYQAIFDSLSLQEPLTIFTDGFESGDMGTWTSSPQ